MNKKRTRDQERNDLWEFLSDVLNEWRIGRDTLNDFIQMNADMYHKNMKLEKELAALKENKP